MQRIEEVPLAFLLLGVWGLGAFGLSFGFKGLGTFGILFWGFGVQGPRYLFRLV